MGNKFYIPIKTKGNVIHTPLRTCKICFESKPLNQFFKVEGCTHFFCTQCTIKYIVSKLKNNNANNIVCPEPQCLRVLNPRYYEPILPSKVFDRWKKALSESAIPEKDKFYCPYNDCSALLHNPTNRVLKTCDRCLRKICARCKAPWHERKRCEKFQSTKMNNDELFLDLAKRRKWRQCPNCKHYIEKVDGCNQVECRCSYRFRYDLVKE